MARLATPTDLKTRLEISGSGQDTRVAQALDLATALIERYCDRTLLYAAADITQVFAGGVGELRLRAWPVLDVAAAPVVKEASDRIFASATALIENTDYYLDRTRGCLFRLPIGGLWLDAGPGTIQVVYRGGYLDPVATPVSGVTVVPTHIQQACLTQAAEIYNRLKDPGYKVVEGLAAGMTTGYAPEVELLKSVQQMLVGERRL